MHPSIGKAKLVLGIAVVVLAFDANLTWASEDQDATTIALETAADRFLFDRGSGRLTSMRSQRAPEVELLATAPDHPAFALDYLGEDRQYRRFDSHDAKKVSTNCTESGQEQKLTVVFSNVGGLDLDVTLAVRTSKKERLSRWSISVRNGAGIRIINVQFPFVVVPPSRDGAVLLPENFGHLRTFPMLDQQPLDDQGQRA